MGSTRSASRAARLPSILPERSVAALNRIIGEPAFSDLLARLLLAPAELPIGIVTAMLGAPFFLYLLMRGRG